MALACKVYFVDCAICEEGHPRELYLQWNGQPWSLTVSFFDRGVLLKTLLEMPPVG